VQRLSKTEEERAALAAALQANFLFEQLNDVQVRRSVPLPPPQQ
jgi:hypothetical protein